MTSDDSARDAPVSRPSPRFWARLPVVAGNLIQHLETGVVTNVSIPAELVVRESA